MNVALDAAVAATKATLVDGEFAPAALHVSTDTRAIEPGDTFLALRGERFDGHDFAAEAVRQGAAMLVLERPEARISGTPAMIVNDSLRAYMALAGVARALFTGRVIAVTGSAGKTTTKEFLAQLLRAKYGERVLATAENENNEIGVSKLFLRASGAAYDAIVVEIGARRYGDVAALVDIARPHVGVLTNVGDAHVEIMGSRERIEETKWALFSRGASAVLNAGDAASRRRAATLGGRPRWFGAYEGSCEIDDVRPLTALRAGRLLNRTDERDEEYDVDVRLPGLHNYANLAGAIAGALELGVELRRLLPELGGVRLPRGRYDRIALANGAQLIYDAYNANAAGTMAALDAFASESAGRRIAVLASMAELGDESAALHELVGAHAAGRVDVLLVLGDYAEDLARGAKRAGLNASRIVAVETNAGAERWLRAHAGDGDAVLLKGSRKYKLEEIVEGLRT